METAALIRSFREVGKNFGKLITMTVQLSGKCTDGVTECRSSATVRQ